MCFEHHAVACLKLTPNKHKGNQKRSYAGFPLSIKLYMYYFYIFIVCKYLS